MLDKKSEQSHLLQIIISKTEYKLIHKGSNIQNQFPTIANNDQ